MHTFDVPGLYTAFRSMPDADFYPQSLEDFVADIGGVRHEYDVVVFFNMHTQTPDARTASALESLGETRQGIVVLHHAILAFPEWQFWSEVCGMEDRDFGVHANQDIRVHVEDPSHAITASLADWEIVDETYNMSDPGSGSHILLTTDNSNSMRTLAWSHQHRNARVFCYQSGHDNNVYADRNFRTVLHRGIRWVAGVL
jgi:type 1 glutamine amidotransferase